MFHIPVDVFAADLSLLVWLWFPPGACELLHVAIRVSSCPYASPIFQRFARTTRGPLLLRGEKRENLTASLSSLLSPLSSLLSPPRYQCNFVLTRTCVLIFFVFSGSFFIFQQYSLSVVGSGSYSYPISLLVWVPRWMSLFLALCMLVADPSLMQLVIWHVRLCIDSATTCFKTNRTTYLSLPSKRPTRRTSRTRLVLLSGNKICSFWFCMHCTVLVCGWN